MPEDDVSQAGRDSTSPSFDFDEDAIAALLDTFVETQTGPQSKRVSRPSDPDDAGARAAHRTVFQKVSRHDALPLVGDSSETRARRITLLETLAERSVGSVRARLLTSAAELREQLGDAEGAVRRYEAALAADARDVIVLRALRRHAIRREDWAAAAKALQKEAALDLAIPERTAALRMLATILLYKLREPAAAEQAAGQAVELQPDDFVAQMLVASACAAREEPQRAAEALISAAERWPAPPQQAVLWLHAAELMEKAGASAGAKVLFERVLEQEPGLLAAHLALVRCMRALGDLPAAVRALQAAATKAADPVATALRRTAAAVAGAIGEHRAAMSMLDGEPDTASRWTLIELAALREDLPRAIATLDVHTGDRAGALAAIDDARRARLAAEAHDHHTLAEVTARAEQGSVWLPYLQALRRLCPDPKARNELARLLETAPRDGAGAAARLLRADEAARASDLSAFLRALAEERDELPETHQEGAWLAIAEATGALSPAERLSALLDAERSRPDDALVRHALWLADDDAERNASRWRAEADRAKGVRAAGARMIAERSSRGAQAWDRACESALGHEPEYWPALWALEMHGSSVEARARAARQQACLAPEIAPAHLLRASLWTGSTADAATDVEGALARSAPDPLLLEHLIHSHGASRENAGDLMRAAAVEQAEASYFARAASAYRDAGSPSRAARALREAEAAAPNDVMVRVQRMDAELEAGEFARLADSAMQRVKDAENDGAQLGALCAMANVDRLARRDMQSARLSLQSIAEMRPEHVPTARALEWDALREQDTERIRSSARRLAGSLDPGCPDRIARRRLTVELLKTDSDILQGDLDRVLRSIDDPLDADPGLARLVLGAAYARGEGSLSVSAMDALRRALVDEVGQQALALEEAAVLRGMGETERALERLHQARPHPLALEEEAHLLQAAGRYEEAASTHRDAAERARSPRRAASLWREAAVLLEERVGDDARATEAWIAAARADITYLDVYRRLANQYRSLGQEEELAAIIQARIDAGADTPTLVALLLEQTEQRRAQGDLEGVIASLQECLELDPQHFVALGQLVDALRAAGNWQGAAEALIRIARLKHSNEEQAWAFSQLGEIYHEHLGDLTRAEASLRRAEELAPGHVETLDRLASVLALEGKPRESARLLERLAHRADSIEQARDYRIRLAGAMEQAGQAKDAELMLEALRAEQPIEPDLILALADFYERRSDSRAEAMHLNRAVNDLRAAIDANPGDENSWTTLVRVLHRRHGPGPASCAASAAIAIGHPASLFEGDVAPKGQALGEPTIPLPSTVDAIVAPAGVPPTVRRLFTLCEHAFDKVLPFDASAWRLRKPSSEQRALIEEAGTIAEVLGISEPRLRITYIAPVACIPISGDPLTLVVGGHLHEMTTAEERVFLFARALKLAASHLAPALRARPEELDVALLALLQSREGGQGSARDTRQTQELRKKLLKAVPRRWRDEAESLILELRGSPSFSTRAASLAISQLGDRVALTLTGDVPSAINGLLKMAGHAAPEHDSSRLQAIRETPEAWALVEFAISDPHFEARAQAGVDR